MALSTAQRLLVAGRMTRAQFKNRLVALAGGDVRLLWMPRATDTTTARTEESPTGRTITWDATVASRLSSLGSGTSQSFASASNHYGTMPDANDLSFGNGTADSGFSIVALANVVDTAAGRNLVSKWNGPGTAREWQFVVLSGDTLALQVIDESAVAVANRISNAAVTQGSWRLLGATYDAAGGSGATVANGMTLYQDGASVASTATNNASYVAMENTAAPVEIGSQNGHTSSYFDGSLALVAVAARALTAAEHAAIAALCRRYFGVP